MGPRCVDAVTCTVSRRNKSQSGIAVQVRLGALFQHQNGEPVPVGRYLDGEMKHSAGSARAAVDLQKRREPVHRRREPAASSAGTTAGELQHRSGRRQSQMSASAASAGAPVRRPDTARPVCSGPE